jgi:hypothetical protein
MDGMQPDIQIVSDPTPPPDRESSLVIEGSAGTCLALTHDGLIVRADAGSDDPADRFWAYADLRDLHLAAYGPIGVIRATLRQSGGELPLLLLEPDQIVSARRTLEIAWNRIGRTHEGRPAA